MSLRRARIKASSAHLATLSGRRRVGATPTPTPPANNERVAASPGGGGDKAVVANNSNEPPSPIARAASPVKAIHHAPIPSPVLRTRQLSGPGQEQPFSPPPPTRTRRLTESRDSICLAPGTPAPGPTVFDQRKADHKKKFVDGIPERTKITMFDLIYYNPSDGNRMSNSSSRRSSRAPSVDSRRESQDAVVPNTLNAVAERLQEEAVDDPNATNSNEKEDDEDDAMPVPQVKVGPDGSIILDEQSTLIETTAAKKAKEDLLKSPLVFESANQATNYGSWGKKKKNADWSDKDTVKFYKGLSVFGTDFSLMEGIFKNRSRHELKMKFKKEERLNRALVDKCLSQGQTFDPSIFDEDSEDNSEEELENAEAKKKRQLEIRKRKRKEKAAAEKAAKAEAQGPPEKKVRRHRVKGRRYYSDSDEGEYADESELASENETSGSILSETKSNNDNSNPMEALEQARILPPRQKRPSRNFTEGPTRSPEKPSLLKSMLSKPLKESPQKQAQQPEVVATPPRASTSFNLPQGFNFPPALLAANPGLVNASPGSLVVVASPSPNVSAPNNQLLHVYMVGDKKTTSNNESTATTAPEQQQSQEGDPPVIAGDHNDRGEVVDDEEEAMPRPPSVPQRTRTISENSLDTTSIGRVRTHSGTQQ